MEVCTHKQYPQYFPITTGKGGGKGIICFLDKISIRMISDLFFAVGVEQNVIRLSYTHVQRNYVSKGIKAFSVMGRCYLRCNCPLKAEDLSL